MSEFVKGFNFDKTLVWQRQSDNCWCFKFLFWPLGQHTTISRGPVWWPGVWRSSHKACGMDDIKACCVPHTKACGVLDIKADDLSQLFTTSEQFWLSKQGNGPLRRGFRAAINPFKMQLDLEECDRPGSGVHIWSSLFRPSFPNLWGLSSSFSYSSYTPDAPTYLLFLFLWRALLRYLYLPDRLSPDVCNLCTKPCDLRKREDVHVEMLYEMWSEK